MSIINEIKAVCRLKDILDRRVMKQTCYVVSDKNGWVDAFVYADNDINNSDRVRSHFAKHTGIKFTDTRCCRLKNAK